MLSLCGAGIAAVHAQGPRQTTATPMHTPASRAAGAGATAVQAAGAVTTPEAFFGFQMGADRKMARWDKMVEYYKRLEQESPKIKVVDMGPTTMGHPFLLVIISSQQNLAKLEQLRQINAKISDPRGVAEAEIKKLVGEGRAVVLQSMSLHATEVGGSQMAPELAYDLLARSDEETRRILDNVVFLMIPSFNPDGQILVTDWYRKTVGTPYEGSNFPELYHKYVGHDNNRDAFQMNMVESQYMAKVMFREWVPQAYVDHHHMGSYGARIYLPPYAEPVRPSADPLVWRELSWYGAHMAYKEEEARKSGVVNAAIYSGWGHFGFHWVTPFHNIAGMLTESAGVRLASPLFIHPDQLKGNTRALPAYEEQTTFPNPWPGGWWRLRDIVERQKISAWATLDLAARNRETVLWNAYLKAKGQTERGAEATVKAYVVPAAQHDRLTAITFIEKLLEQGVDVRQANKEFLAGDRRYGAGSFVIPMAQPKMGLVRWLLGRTRYPDNSYTRDRDETPIRPYDMATDTMVEFMGVRADAVETAVTADLVKLTAPLRPAGTVTRSGTGYVLDGRLNASFTAANLLQDKGVAISRVTADAAGGDPALRAGDFIVAAGNDAVLTDVAKTTGVDFAPLKSAPKSGTHAMKRLRVGMYQRYFGGNMDEGWTRWLLEQYEFTFSSLSNADLRGDLSTLDVLIFADEAETRILAGHVAGTMPDAFVGGLGVDGAANVRRFVERGGWLVAWDSAADFAITALGLPLRNTVKGTRPEEFFIPGSLLHVNVTAAHPLAAGMEPRAVAMFSDSQAFAVVPPASEGKQRAARDVDVFVEYPRKDLLLSGWELGASRYVAGRVAGARVPVGQGQAVIYGFRPAWRGQPHNTFKLLFNPLYLSTIDGPFGAPAATASPSGR